MNETLDYIRSFASFPRALPRFLKNPLTLEVARRVVADRLEHREANFLRIVEQAIYGRPTSPYLALLRMAGCELGDLKALVKNDGLEGALQSLRSAGVYVTFEEFKGRKPIVRGSTTIPVGSSDFDNPGARRDLTLTTGGSTGLATNVHHDLDYIAATAPLAMLVLNAWNVLRAPAVFWMHILPGAGLRFILQYARFAKRPAAWYSRGGWFDSGSWLKYGLATVYGVFWLRVFGARVPLPRVAGQEDARVIVRRVRRLLDEAGECLVLTNVSAGVRLALAAEASGVSLQGATLRVGGEPITAAKAAAIRRSGARMLPAYGAIETGAIGLGCPRPTEVDHMHLATDSLALVPHPIEVPGTGITVDAFNLTSLVDASPKVMLNYQIDDYGVVGRSSCGCALHDCGLTTTVHAIASYGKLLSEGVTLFTSEAQRVLEDVLPARFGGSVLDYQLLEREDGQGLNRLFLIVSPRVTLRDEQEPARVLLDALCRSSARADVASRAWDQAGTLQVLRREPVTTSRGKMMPLYREPRACDPS